ncbi:MAG: site-specific DNA-methyltransferase [Holophagales bacterium]|nr:site-specific DNA-methyltransferase [Holophagales bacterium]MYG30693.1 site-specific DNA-methyltransferase [Holophagales bacterium]MYI81633.1 site-specific DNA-methyltransferase [Holophagales bacterium]
MSILGSFDLVPNSLYYGDCLDVMSGWSDGQFDLVYLDPPFNSKANYNQLFGTENGVPAQVRAFEDTWVWNAAAAERYDRFSRAIANPAHQAILGMHQILGESGMLAYLTYMAERLLECRRMLKPTGSIYLHCDPTASHYLKVLMDAMFGPPDLQNEIVWHYRRWTGKAKRLQRLHDIVLFYTRSKEYTFNVPYDPYTEKSLARKQHYHTRIKGDDIYVTSIDKKGVRAGDVWQIPVLNSQAKERLGYPTQKPRVLLERIITASSNVGDLVLDPFCGCGTTVDAANRLGRKWVGIDISPFAARLVRDRRLKDAGIPIHGIPTDMEGARLLLESNPFDFEAWIVMSVAGLAANEIQIGDGGIDGRGRMFSVPDDETGLVLAQVKGGGYTASALRDFEGTMARENATAGIFVTLKRVTTPKARAAAAAKGEYKVGATRYPRLQFWSAEEYFSGSRPHLPAMADPYTGKAVQSDLFTG